MPFHFNRVELSGTLTRDPEVKYTPKGTAVAEIGLAINRYWKDDRGQKMEETTFVDCEAWGRTAEVLGEWTKKGHTIFIEGRLKLDQWDDKQTGAKRSKLRVVIEKMNFVSKPKGDSGGDYEGDSESAEDAPPSRPPAKQYQQQSRRPAAPPRDPDLDAAGEDDIPF